MPIFWRYLLQQYLKVLFLCTAAFIAVLLTTRLDEIAHFMTLAPSPLLVAEFILHQIPYVLPIALPISCLISTVILFKTLSITHELTAFRSCGIAIKNIMAPILAGASLLGVLNFYVVSELATHSHLQASLLKNELRSVNPLLLLHNKHLLRLKGIYFDTLGPSKLGESASDIVLAMPNKTNTRINVMIAQHVKASPFDFSGSGITLITSLDSDSADRFDQLMIENIAQTSTTIDDFSQMIQKKVWTINHDHLKFPLLKQRLKEHKKILKNAQQEGLTDTETKQKKKELNRVYSEIIRRISLGLAVVTLTLMGAAFGTSISRNRSNRGIIWIMILTAFYLVAYFAAKAVEHQLLLSAMLYILPQLLIILLSIRMFDKISQGIE